MGGVIENMSGFTCPHCGETTDIFKRGGGEKISREMGVKFLGSIPLDEEIMERGDSGRSFFEDFDERENIISIAFKAILNNIENLYTGVRI